MQILSRFGSKPPATGHGLHMDDHGLVWAAVQLERGQELVWVHCLFELLAPGCIVGGQIVEFAQVEAALKRLQAGARPPPDTEPERRALPPLALAVPAGLVSFHKALFPVSLSESALIDRAQASMAAHMGCSPSQLRVDFFTGPPDPAVELTRGPKKLRVLHLAAVPRDAVEDRIALVEAAGMPCQPVLMAVSAEINQAQDPPEAWSAFAGAAACELATKALQAIQPGGKFNKKPTDSFNFLPFRAALRLYRQRLFLRLSAGMLLLVLLTAVLGRWALSEQLAAVHALHADVRKDTLASDAEAQRKLALSDQPSSLQGHEAALIAFQQSREQVPQLLQELDVLLPPGLQLTGLRQEAQNYVLTGQAQSAAEVFELIERMAQHSRHLAQPTVQTLSLLADGPAVLSGHSVGAAREAVFFSLRAQSP